MDTVNYKQMRIVDTLENRNRVDTFLTEPVEGARPRQREASLNTTREFTRRITDLLRQSLNTPSDTQEKYNAVVEVLRELIRSIYFLVPETHVRDNHAPLRSVEAGKMNGISETSWTTRRSSTDKCGLWTPQRIGTELTLS